MTNRKKGANFFIDMLLRFKPGLNCKHAKLGYISVLSEVVRVAKLSVPDFYIMTFKITT